MKQKKANNSGKAHLGLLVAVVLAAGSAGVWSELQGAVGGPNPNPRIAGRAISAFGNISDITISENGDGTAFIVADAFLEGDGSFLTAVDFAAPVYSISTSLLPGHSGNRIGSGTGQVDINGFHISADGNGTPVLIHAEVNVIDATNNVANVNNGIRVERDPVTGQNIATRVNRQGTAAYGFTAASITVSGDGSVVEETGGFGAVDEYTINSVVRIR